MNSSRDENNIFIDTEMNDLKTRIAYDIQKMYDEEFLKNLSDLELIKISEEIEKELEKRRWKVMGY
jgi:hypothetical protein